MSGAAEIPAIAVLAGGLATRMQPLTHAVQKSMLKVTGKPIIARVPISSAKMVGLQHQ